MLYLALVKYPRVSKPLTFTLNNFKKNTSKLQLSVRHYTSKQSLAPKPRSKWSLFGSNRLKTSTPKNLSIFSSVRWHGISGRPSTITNGAKKKLSNKEILQRLLRFVWPKENNMKIKLRVVFAMGLLIGSKLLTISVPFIFKNMVDFLNKNGKISEFTETNMSVLALTVIAMALGYGAARAGASLCGELRNAIFARVAQSSVTSLATQVFRHLHKLDLNFHLNRQTGALSKAIDRGLRSFYLP